MRFFLSLDATKTMCCAEIIPEPAVNTSNDNTRLLDDIDEEDVVDAGNILKISMVID